MNRPTIFIIALFIAFASSRSQAVSPGTNRGGGGGARGRRPHRIFQHGVSSKTGPNGPRAMNVKAPGAALAPAAQASSGGNSNPLLQTKKHPRD